MCGIAGFVDRYIEKNQADKLLPEIMRSIAHRGPDARSIFVESPVYLGHNRLSIIDLSEQANQPFQYGDLVMIYNGEVYNYIEIRNRLIQKGYAFHTQSDTEVILAAYKEWGSNCVNEFTGMWAFVIYDQKKKIVFASRDRFGIKPFYFIHRENRFYFASEYKALKAAPVFSNALNMNQVARGL